MFKRKRDNDEMVVRDGPGTVPIDDPELDELNQLEAAEQAEGDAPG